MADPPARDIFDRAREWVSAGLFFAGALAIVGSLLDWVRFSIAEPAVPGTRPSEPLTGLDVGDGKAVIAVAVLVILAAFLYVLRQRGAGWAMLASMAIGAIGVSDYRSIGEVASEVDVVGIPHAAIGLTLVLVASVLGLLASVAGLAATPRET